jgi:GNAT superfamily N-acetyltransferase
VRSSAERVATGLDYLDLVTALLHRVRVEAPYAGLWEAADFQWWWRRERASDHIGQLFWVDEAGAPEAAVIFTDWGRAWACDPIVVPSRCETLLPVVWSRALERIDALALDSVEVAVRDGDTLLTGLLVDSGFARARDETVTTWMPSGERRPVAVLPEQFRLLDRVDASDRPHHMIERNGEKVAERLSQTPLYRPDLDLFIEGPNGEVVAYGLFWWDPVTLVGLVEPMRTEEAYWRRGLGRCVLTAGLDRLAALGATRLKISYEPDNPAAEKLYLGVGFRPESTASVYAFRRA